MIRLTPLRVALFAVLSALLVAMAGCTAAWIDQQSYVPSPNVCRADEVTRTDCVHLDHSQISAVVGVPR